MRLTLKPVSIVLALAMLASGPALCQEPPSEPRLPVQEPVRSAEPAPADTSVSHETSAAATDTLKAPAQPASSDTASPGRKPARKPYAFKPGKLKLDRNGKIFMAATAGLFAGVYLVYRFFWRDVGK
jgi:hypothetical protein